MLLVVSFPPVAELAMWNFPKVTLFHRAIYNQGQNNITLNGET
jgi:hypothetical protein